MPYNLEKMQLPEIKMLFEVLEEIRKSCSTRNNAFVILGRNRKTENVSAHDFIHIIGSLDREGYVKRYIFWTSCFGTTIRIINKKFEPFYYAVSKRLNTLQQNNRPIQKSSEKDLSLDFNSQKSILYFKNFEIKMSLKNDKTNAHYILEHIFKSDDLKQQTPFAEIAEDTFGEEYTNWKKYHRACEDIQEKVRKKTGVDDFLIFTSGRTGWVKINEKYLE